MFRAAPYTLLVLLGVIWGANFLFMKEAVERISPLQVAWLRVAFGAAPIIALASWRKEFKTTDLAAWRHLLTMALLANIGPYVFFVIGTAHLSSGVAGAISGAIPVMTALIVAIAIPSEKLALRAVLGVALGFEGVLLVSGDLSGGSAVGVAAMLAGSLSYALAVVYARRFITQLGMSAVKLAAYQTGITMLMLTLFIPKTGTEAILSDMPALVGLVLGLGFVGTGLAFVIYYYLIERLGAIKAASVYYLPPAVALFLGYAARGETVSTLQMVGAFAIALGVFLATTASQQRHS
jgi:drug/metabolite transporter (DMT)-like permease